MTGFNMQQTPDEYRIQFTTDDKQHALNVMHACERAVDGYEGEVVPVIRARFELKHLCYDENLYVCSACGDERCYEEGTPKDNGIYFCPNCGAKIDFAERDVPGDT